MNSQRADSQITQDERLPVAPQDQSTWDERQQSPTESPSSEDERNPVDVLADEFAARLRAGEHPSLDEYTQRYPEHAAAIRAIFPAIALMEGSGQKQRSDQQHERRVQRLGEDGTETLGDFRIVGEIGRGGMGIVFAAVQQSLHRRVALKVLHPNVASSERQRQRFHREAESAAKLHHTNIVPVYAIGEERGFYFYAMQFIDGLTVSALVARERKQTQHRTDQPASDATAPTVLVDAPSDQSGSLDATKITSAAAALAPLKTETNSDEPRLHVGDIQQPLLSLTLHRAASIALQVAHALYYAHQHGMLHRDIKPANLMLDREDNVWITDFGLVKLADVDDLTGTGDLVGTVRYMAPEQLEGKADPRTDIFSLGLTLFELCTLRPAFEGDQNSTLTKRLKHQGIPRPRTINSAIPRDLETIIVKATAHDPSARYQTAAALAEDLQRFIDDRPILARRESLIRRAIRWSRRNPALASLGAVSVAALIAVAGVEWRGRLQVESALQSTKLEHRRAESNVKLAIDAFDSILNNVTSRGVPQSLALDLPADEQGLSHASLSAADALLLDQLLGFYRRFALENSDNTRLSERIAAADFRAAIILIRLGQLTEAESQFRQSLGSIKKLLEREPQNSKLLSLTAQIHNELGQLALRRSDFHETLQAHLDALTVFVDLPDSVMTDPALRFEKARATDLYASIDIRSGTDQGPGGPQGPEANGRRLDGPQGDGPSDDGPRPPQPPRNNKPDRGPGPREFANRQGPPNRVGDRPPQEPREFSDRPGPPPGERGQRPPLDGMGDRPDGPPPFDGDRKPPFENDQPLEARLRAIPAPMRGRQKDMLEGLASVLTEARDEFRKLVSEFPDNPKYQFALTQCLSHRLVLAATRQDAATARDSFNEAVSNLERLTQQSPNEPSYVFALTDMLTQAARAQSRDDAKASLQRSVAMSEQLATRFPQVSEYQLLQGTAHSKLAATQAAAGEVDAAEASLRRSLDILAPLGARYLDQGPLQIPLAKVRQQLGDLLRESALSSSNNPETKAAKLEASRHALQEACDDINGYCQRTNGGSRFANSTLKSVSESLAATLLAMNRPADAEQARQLSRQLGR